MPVTDPTLSALEEVLRLRPEFRYLARQSGRALNERHSAQLTGAGNLLTKALAALASGDEQRADRLVQRAAQMPYDSREAESPGVGAVRLLLYSVIADEFDVSEHEDMTWLDVVLDVHPSLDSLGQTEVASVVHGFVLQDAIFDASPAEKRRIKRVFGDAPLDADVGDEPDATVEQRQQIIRSLTEATLALRDAYAAAAGASST